MFLKNSGYRIPNPKIMHYLDVSKNNGIPKSSILIEFSIIFTIHFGVFPYFWKHPSTSAQCPHDLPGFLHLLPPLSIVEALMNQKPPGLQVDNDMERGRKTHCFGLTWFFCEDIARSQFFGSEKSVVIVKLYPQSAGTPVLKTSFLTERPMHFHHFCTSAPKWNTPPQMAPQLQQNSAACSSFSEPTTGAGSSQQHGWSRWLKKMAIRNGFAWG